LDIVRNIFWFFSADSKGLDPGNRKIKHSAGIEHFTPLQPRASALKPAARPANERVCWRRWENQGCLQIRQGCWSYVTALARF